jgi:peptide/nickel transport system permease protein
MFVILAHLIPNFASHLIVSITTAVPNMILAETALSFIGVGMQDPAVSWGVLLQETMNFSALVYYPWKLIPVIPVILVVVMFNAVGDGLRDAVDPYSL